MQPVVAGFTTEIEGASQIPIERVKVYSAGLTWEESWFHLTGFYRMGHTHWSYEGDFFGLYQDAFYGNFIDIYNGEAPIGAELVGRRKLEGLKLAFGPQLWWGANPAFFARYTASVPWSFPPATIIFMLLSHSCSFSF